MLKKVLFTDSDMDGCGCKIVFELAHRHLKEGVDFTVVNLQHGAIDNEVMEYIHNGYMTNTINGDTLICFSDLCASKETLIEIQKTNRIRIWDHHASALYALDIVPDAIIQIENEFHQLQSGTSIIYKYFCNVGFSCTTDTGRFFTQMTNDQSNLVGQLIDAIRAYDTFEFKQTGDIHPKELNTLFYMLGFDNFYDRYMDRILNCTSTSLIDSIDMKFVNARLSNEASIIDKFLQDTLEDPEGSGLIVPININGLKVAFTYGAKGASISELGYQWLSMHPEFDAMASISLGEKISFTFRSVKNDVNVGQNIAVPLGGGGHPKAAGTVANEEFCNKLMQLIINYLTSINHE